VIRRVLLVVAAALVAALALPPLCYAVFPEPVPELPSAGRRVEVAPGVGVNVLDSGGPGPPIVLVHGHPGSAYDWAPLGRELAARGHRVIAYDRLGYGHSDARANGAFTVESNARELRALLDAEDLRDVVLVGWSYGGGTAIVATREDPSRVSHLVLVGSVGAAGVEDRDAPPRLVMEFMVTFGLPWLARVPPLDRRLRAAFLGLAFAPEPVSDGGPDGGQLRPTPHARDLHLRGAGPRRRGRPRPRRDRAADPRRPGRRRSPRAPRRGRGFHRHRRAGGSELWVVPGGGHALPVTRARELAERIVAFAGSR
jgi:pimeloyl-ACP methyl ester carboxylesterase